VNIDSVNIDKNYYTKQSDNQYRKSTVTDNVAQAQTTNVRSDTLVLSTAAQKLVNIKNKINSGEYDKPEVIQETAEKIYSSLNSDAQTQTTDKA